MSIEITDEDLESIEPDGESIETSTPEEVTFDVEGNKVPFSKLTPDVVRQFYDSHINKSKWTAENTKRAQEFASSKKEWETKRPDYETKYGEWKQFTDFVGKHPQLQKEMQDIVGKYAQQQGNGSVAAQPTFDPRIQELTGKVSQFERYFEEQKQKEQQSKADADRQTAYAELKKKDPNFDQQKFDEFLAKATSESENMTGLYSLIHQAMLGSNKDTIIKEAEKKTLDNIKKKQTAGIEKGTGTSPASLPDNKDYSGNKSTIDMMEAIMKEMG
jgi:hypothetical protein